MLPWSILLPHEGCACGPHIGSHARIDNAELVSTHVNRIEIKRAEIAISLPHVEHASYNGEASPPILAVPWGKAAHRRHRDIIVREGVRAEILPIRGDTRVKLVTAIARGRQWLIEIEAGAATVADSKRHVNMTISLVAHVIENDGNF
jgi:site-specific DNA recombinase